MKNLIVIVGGNHHNGLGLARIFGLNGFEVHAMVVDNKLKNYLLCSKFVKESRTFKSERDALDYVKRQYAELSEKAFIIPYSDRTAIELDLRLSEFAEKFYLPSINGIQGKIAELMDKDNQYSFAKKNGIRMASTWTINLQNEAPLNDEIVFPCILKPVVSAEGHKTDIVICDNKDEFLKAIATLKEKNYTRILVQEYLMIDYEIDVFGCICKDETSIYLVPTKTIRSWPPKGGTNSFSQIIVDDNLINECKKIISVIKNEGFYGLYDIELFVVDGEVLLNEINFRNSGDVYMAVNQEYYYPVIWVKDVLGLSNKGVADHPARPEYSMTECADIRHAIFEKYSFSKWLNDYKRSTDYALKFKGDMKPVIKWYKYYLCQVMKKILGLK